MAMTNAERQRRHYERQKAKKKAELTKAEAVDTHMRTPFFEFAADWSVFRDALDLAGIDAPTFDDDAGARSFSGEVEQINEQWGAEDGSDNPYQNAHNSLGRAEVMVGSLIDATGELARIINDYKRKEITDRIHEIETADLSDPDTRKRALADIVRLKKMLDQLDKQVRWTFPQWKVTGE